MTFDLDTFTAAKLMDVVVLSQKNRAPDENPGAKLALEIELNNASLAYFDGALQSFLFVRNANNGPQTELVGIEPVSDMPNLSRIGERIGALHWDQELTGYDLTIDFGLGGKRNLRIADCTLSNWRITPKHGGTVQIKLDVESADVSEAIFGKLAKLKSLQISILLEAPGVAQQQLAELAAQPGPAAQAKGRRKPEDPTAAFLAAHHGQE